MSKKESLALKYRWRVFYFDVTFAFLFFSFPPPHFASDAAFVVLLILEVIKIPMSSRSTASVKTKKWDYNDPDEPYIDEEESDQNPIVTDEENGESDNNLTTAVAKQRTIEAKEVRQYMKKQQLKSKQRSRIDDDEVMTPTTAYRNRNKYVLLRQTSSAGGKSTPKTPRTSQVAAQGGSTAANNTSNVTQSPSSVHTEGIVSKADSKRRRIRKLEEHLKTLEDKQEALDYSRERFEKALEICRSELLGYVQEEMKLLEEMPAKIKQARLSARFDLEQSGSATKKQRTNQGS